jgi:adenosylhomocysteinase
MDSPLLSRLFAVNSSPNQRSLKPKFTLFPKTSMEKIAELKLQSMGIAIDVLTEEQKRYLSTWEMGTT